MVSPLLLRFSFCIYNTYTYLFDIIQCMPTEGLRTIQKEWIYLCIIKENLYWKVWIQTVVVEACAMLGSDIFPQSPLIPYVTFGDYFKLLCEMWIQPTSRCSLQASLSKHLIAMVKQVQDNRLKYHSPLFSVIFSFSDDLYVIYITWIYTQY